jgi:glycosyltransferase involved in cell wall biosynthesis
MKNISFCIPSKNNLRYLKVAIKYLRSHCNPTHEILVWVDKDDDGTSAYLQELNDKNLRYWVNDKSEPFGIGNAYNFLVDNASNELVMMYHADMIAGKDMDTEVLKHITKGAVVSATRIEPPLHGGEPCKIVEDFGLWPEEDVVDGFVASRFNTQVERYKQQYMNKTTPGIFAPWLIHKEDYLALGGHDERLNSLAEDIDIFNRMALANYTLVQSWEAFVYHLTCRGGQFEHAVTTDDLRQRSNAWNNLSITKTREFIRKWGFGPMAGPLREPIIWPQIPRKVKLVNCTNTQAVYTALSAVEPYFTEVSLDNEILKNTYVHAEQTTTSFDLAKKFTSWTPEMVTIEFDVQKLQSSHFNEVIAKLALILSEIEEAGRYEYDIFTIDIPSQK